jgi:hypothetical protein
MNYFTKSHLISCISILVITSSCKKHLTGNLYIDSKVSVNQQHSMEEQKIIAKQNKAYAAQLEKNKKAIKKNNDRFFRKKKQYKHITKNKRRIKRTRMRGVF